MASASAIASTVASAGAGRSVAAGSAAAHESTDLLGALARPTHTGFDPTLRILQAEARVFSNDVLQVSAASGVDGGGIAPAPPGTAGEEPAGPAAHPMEIRLRQHAVADDSSAVAVRAEAVAEPPQTLTRHDADPVGSEGGAEHESAARLAWIPQSVTVTPGFEPPGILLVAPIGWSSADQHPGTHNAGAAPAAAGFSGGPPALMATLSEEAASSGLLAANPSTPVLPAVPIPAGVDHRAVPALDEMLSSGNPHEQLLASSNPSNPAVRTPASLLPVTPVVIDHHQLLSSLLAHREEA